jgi:hypothetical protein
MLALCIVLGLVIFGFLRLLTDPIHDALFLSHSIVVDVADDEREYTSWFWQVLGNSFAVATTLARGLAGYVFGYVAYQALKPFEQSTAGRRIWLKVGRPILFLCVMLFFVGVVAVFLYVFASK